MHNTAVLLLLFLAIIFVGSGIEGRKCRQECEETSAGGCAEMEAAMKERSKDNFYSDPNMNTTDCPSAYNGCAWFKCPDQGQWWGCRKNNDCTPPCKTAGTSEGKICVSFLSNLCIPLTMGQRIL